MSEAYTEQDLQRAKSFVIGAGGVDICLCPDENCRPRFESELAAEFSRIRSEARAGMREACAKYFEDKNKQKGHAITWHLILRAVVEDIRNLPDTAADEAIERIKSQVRQDQLRTDIGRIRCWLDKSGAGLEEVISNPGLDPTAKGLAEAVILLTERIKAEAEHKGRLDEQKNHNCVTPKAWRERIADLTAAAKENP